MELAEYPERKNDFLSIMEKKPFLYSFAKF